jgi:hypothetical protein
MRLYELQAKIDRCEQMLYEANQGGSYSEIVDAEQRLQEAEDELDTYLSDDEEGYVPESYRWLHVG